MVSKDGIVKTVVDIGSGKIKAIIGELSADGQSLKVLKYVDGPSKGMIKGDVVDGEALSQSILAVIERLREETNQPIEAISIGITGEKIKSATVNSELVFDQEEKINDSHMQQLIKKAEQEILTEDEQVLKTELYNLRVDNSGIVKNPIGVLGEKIQADVHLLFTSKEAVSKLVETVNRIGVDVEKIVLNAYASAKATLDEEDMRMGVALADIGEGTIDIILYKNEKLIYMESIPLGGRHFKTDLMYVFKFEEEEIAEEILNKYRNKEIAQDGNIYYQGAKHISLIDLERLIDARVNEMIEYIDSTIQKSGFNGYLGKGLILTGGVIGDKLLNGEKLLEEINKKTGYVARRVLPSNFTGLGPINSSMATVIGLFYEVMEEEDKKMKTGSYTSQEIEVKNEKVVQPEEETEFTKLLEEEEEETQEEENKTGIMKSIKDWFSNFI